MTLRVEDQEAEWTPLRASVDVERFTRGQVGPYRIGKILRVTDFGDVSIAIHEAIERVVEVELFTTLVNQPAAGPEGKLMPDLAHASSVEHPNVARIIGAGVEGDVPYVVRPLVIGRTLADVESRGSLSAELSACVVFALAEGLGALSEHGPEPGACSIGGFDQRDVLLTFVGGVLILGSGTREARAPGEDPVARDRHSLIHLAKKLGLGLPLEGHESFAELAKKLRYAHRDALAKRRELVGREMRERFDGELNEERAFFGLAPLQ